MKNRIDIGRQLKFLLKTPEPATVFFATALAVSMTFSPFVLSLSMWGLVFIAYWEAWRQCQATGMILPPRRWSSWWTVLRQSFINWFRRPDLLWFAGLFLMVALSGLWSEDPRYWAERTRVRIPFFVLPWVFANLPALSLRQRLIPLYVLVWSLVLICIGVGIHFMLHFDAVMDGLRQGQPVPVPRHHIRFNLILATGILTGGWLWQQGFVIRYRWERLAMGLAVVFLFVFIHILSVRSGLAALYGALLFSLGWYLYHTRRWITALAALAVLILIPVVAVQTIPSLQQRISYMSWDWGQYREGGGENYSDSERWVSLQAGWKLWKANPLLGVGAGDLRQETAKLIATEFPAYQKTPRLPHNQWLYIMAGTGLAGLLLSALAFFYPFCYRHNRQTYLFMTFQVIAMLSFLVEYTIETSIGVAFYLFFTLWMMKVGEG